jgi:hypothetical protein
MESAGHYAKTNGASPEGWHDLGKETKRHQAASGITF